MSLSSTALPPRAQGSPLRAPRPRTRSRPRFRSISPKRLAVGRLFALLSMTKLGGSVGGSLYCTAQFQVSLDAASGPYFLRGGAAPVVWLALPSLLALLALACVLPPAAGGERDASAEGCEEVSVEEESSSSIEASPRVKRHDR